MTAFLWVSVGDGLDLRRGFPNVKLQQSECRNRTRRPRAASYLPSCRRIPPQRPFVCRLLSGCGPLLETRRPWQRRRNPTQDLLCQGVFTARIILSGLRAGPILEKLLINNRICRQRQETDHKHNIPKERAALKAPPFQIPVMKPQAFENNWSTYSQLTR
jgi:hypothetical protein